MASPNSIGGTSHGPYPAHSNPNLIQRHPGSIPILERSSSQPPDMFCWEDSITSMPQRITTCADRDTQTDNLLEQSVEQYILENPNKVLSMLGINSDLLPGKLNNGGLRRSRTTPDNHLHSIAVNKVILNNNNHEGNDMSIEIIGGDDEEHKTPWDFSISTENTGLHPMGDYKIGICETEPSDRTTDS